MTACVTRGFLNLSAADHSPILRYWLTLTSLEESNLHVTLAIAAADICARKGCPLEPRVWNNLGKAISITNARISVPGYATTDAGLAAIVMHAAVQLMFGNARAYRVHLRMLQHLIAERGGPSELQESNLTLAGAIAHVDYGGAIALLTRRCFYWKDEEDTPLSDCPTSGLPSEVAPWVIPHGWAASWDVLQYTRDIVRLLRVEETLRQASWEAATKKTGTVARYVPLGEQLSEELSCSLAKHCLTDTAAATNDVAQTALQAALITALTYFSGFSRKDWPKRILNF